MQDKISQMAEQVGLLPRFTGVLLDGREIKLPVKLNHSEVKTLMFIFHDQGQTMTEYSKRVGLAKGSFTTVADTLAEQGYISRERLPSDRRKQILQLTGAGIELARKIHDEFKRNIAIKLALLDQDDIKRLEKALAIIAELTNKLKNRKELDNT